MGEDTDKEKETDWVKQLVLVRKKEKNSHTHACARPGTQTHTHTPTRNSNKKPSHDYMQTRHCRLPPQGGAVQAVRQTHLPVGGGVGEEGHVGGELAPEPDNKNPKNIWITTFKICYVLS